MTVTGLTTPKKRVRMAFPGELHTITYEERDNVAWITLNRPEVHNAFNEQMQRELQRVWRGLRRVDSVRRRRPDGRW